MEYPIYENGREIGRLLARQEGLYTVFEARLPEREGLTRLYLCGKGECRLLGVMEPGREGCRLCRRLSRRELPKEITHASTAPEEETEKGGAAAHSRLEERENWTEGARGMLYHRSGGLLAIPADLRRGSGEARLLQIGGKEYIVFRWQMHYNE